MWFTICRNIYGKLFIEEILLYRLLSDILLLVYNMLEKPVMYLIVDRNPPRDIFPLPLPLMERFARFQRNCGLIHC